MRNSLVFKRTESYGESISENRGLQIFPVLHDFVAKSDMYRLLKKKRQISTQNLETEISHLFKKLSQMESLGIHVVIVFFDTASWPTQNAQTDLFVSLQLICLPPKCACKIHCSQLPAGFFLSPLFYTSCF